MVSFFNLKCDLNKAPQNICIPFCKAVPTARYADDQVRIRTAAAKVASGVGAAAEMTAACGAAHQC